MPPNTFAGLQEGVLEEWNVERGFGFIRPVAEGPRAFVNVSFVQPFRTLCWCAVAVNCVALAVFADAASDVVARIVGGA